MEISTTRSRSGRSVRVLVNGICLVVMLFAVAFIVPTALGLQRYVITGSSMGGSIELGSVVFSEVVPVNDLQVGDVITYVPPADSGIDHLVTHRIASIEGDVYRTRGDANADVDPWTFQLTSTSQARVKYSVPYVGYVLIALQDRSLRMLLIGIPAALIALISLVQLVGALRGVRRRPAARPTTSVTAMREPSVPVGG